jgi:hypothetical protein
MKRLGLIQSRGIGDIIIALPIAKYYHDRGWQVCWPIDRRFLPSFVSAVDYVEFIPFDFEPTLEGFLMKPMRLLKEKGCEKIIPLYSHLSGTSIANADYFRSLKFDEYKYAIAGVPFAEKWNLQIKRDASREQALFDRVVQTERYTVRQTEGSNVRFSYSDADVAAGGQVIDITNLTDNVFDWLLVLERAQLLVLVDSCFANLVDQLNLGVRKKFIFRSDLRFTPVMRSAWEFCAPNAAATPKRAVAACTTNPHDHFSAEDRDGLHRGR